MLFIGNKGRAAQNPKGAAQNPKGAARAVWATPWLRHWYNVWTAIRAFGRQFFFLQ